MKVSASPYPLQCSTEFIAQSFTLQLVSYIVAACSAPGSRGNELRGTVQGFSLNLSKKGLTTNGLIKLLL